MFCHFNAKLKFQINKQFGPVKLPAGEEVFKQFFPINVE